MKARPGTFALTLPTGEKVLCWRRDAAAIQRDVLLGGDVCLLRDPLTGVYDRVEPTRVSAIPESAKRRVGG